VTGLYRKLPIPVEARQVLGSEDGQTGRDLADWCGGSVGGLFAEPKVLVPTLEGDLVARVGDWIVKGPRGEFWPVKGSIFAETYERADQAPEPPRTGSARMELHVALSLRLDAIEAYRLANAYRVENREEAADWFAGYPFPPADTDWSRGRADAIAWVVSVLRNPNPQRGEQTDTATFFQPGHVYAREHHGRTIEFLVRSVDTPPGSSWQVARGWRLNEDGDWEPTDSDDLTGWTDVTDTTTGDNT
jgi:hypothetical protein